MEKLDKIALQVIDDCCARIHTYLDAALHYLGVIEVSDKARETSLVRTKIDEAQLWLRKYNDGIKDELQDEAGGD